jgi:hypothetical protein
VTTVPPLIAYASPSKAAALWTCGETAAQTERIESASAKASVREE